MDLQLFKNTLKKHGLSTTQERKCLFELLDKQHEPIPMKQLVDEARHKINRSTVYRTVDLFEKIGVVSRVYTGWKYRIELSDSFSSHHHHMTCVQCDTIIAFDELPHFHDELKKLEQKHSFTVQSHSFELKGLCKSCH